MSEKEARHARSRVRSGTKVLVLSMVSHATGTTYCSGYGMSGCGSRYIRPASGRERLGSKSGAATQLIYGLSSPELIDC